MIFVKIQDSDIFIHQSYIIFNMEWYIGIGIEMF